MSELGLARSDSLPPPIVNIHLQLPTNNTRDTMLQPNRPQQRIIAFLMQEQLSAMAQTGVHFAVFVDVGRDHPRTGDVVQVVDGAFADVEEET